jgi:hypothetical protein
MAKRFGLAGAMHWSTPKLAAHASKFIAVSHSVAQRALQGGVARTKVTVIPNFFDTTSREPSMAPAEPTALFVGPDSPREGRPVALAAFSRLPSGTATLVLVGSGAPVNADGVVDLGYLRSAELGEHIVGRLSLLSPTVWLEPCPTVLLEAMTPRPAGHRFKDRRYSRPYRGWVKWLSRSARRARASGREHARRVG